MKNQGTRKRRYGFTLIELLVVISIIALLIGILLPALGAARRTAQKAVCLSNLRSAGQGLAIYGADNRDWIPGPNTSGMHLNDSKFDNGEDEGSTSPLQNFDWISPSLGNSIGLPDDAAKRLESIFTNDFRCPTNDAIYDSQYGSGITPPGGTQDLVINSYSAISQFMVAPKSGDGKIYIRGWINSEVQVPESYDSRQDLVGNATAKVWVLDGARYVDNSSGEVTFNAFPRQFDGGNYASWGPAMSRVVRNGNPYKRVTDQEQMNAEKFAYRHNGAVNAAFFDGHGESMTPEEAERVEHYFPGGSKVLNTSNLNDDSVEVGTIIN
ncbi:prepilin-type N-terminal cleavage/methylation domain-containing protein [Planctomycetota bacterium]|nr:prepilin-type N-terminal cleavage/methylation domain-containing protein [Planctomycetota bacterium]